MKKILIILLSLILIVPIFGIAETHIAKYQLTDEEQESIDSLKGKAITIGYISGYSEVLAEHIIQMMVTEFGLIVSGVEYDGINELYEAVSTGEVDIASGVKTNEELTNLYYSESIYRDYRIIITTNESTIDELAEMAYLKVGFLSNKINYNLSKDTIEAYNIEPVFYDSYEEVSNALNDGRVVAFVGSSSDRELVINDPNLITRTAIKDNPSGLKLATSNPDYSQLIEISAKVIGDLSDKVRGEALEKKISKYEKELVHDYVEEHYSAVELPSTLKVESLKDNYPYSYINEDGKFVGIYIDFLDFFTEVLGIDYEMVNEDTETTYEEILNNLDTNQVQLVLGTIINSDYHNVEQLESIKISDPLISLQNEDLDLRDFSSVDGLDVGVAEGIESFAKDRFKGELFTYDSNADAIEGLLNNEYDILLTKKSVLDYYQRIERNGSLIQSDYIYKEYPYMILGNKENQELNYLIEDMERIFSTLEVGDSDVNLNIQNTLFLNGYLNTAKNRDAILSVTILMAIAFIFLIVIFFVVIHQQRLKEYSELQNKHFVDELTGIWNRYSYRDKCNQVITKNSDKLGTFIFLDLNFFKRVNDTYGHHNGDLILVEFAKGLKSFENQNIVPFRIAGDEFGIYAGGFDTLEELESFVQRIAEYPYHEIEIQEYSTSVTIKYSLGYAIYPLDSESLDELHVYADFAMYQAKENKNRNKFNCQVAKFDKDFYDGKFCDI